MIREERRDDGVAVLALDRPAQRNALSVAMLEALEAALARARDARCVVVLAEGPAFCAGHDLRELTAARQAPDGGRAFFERTLGLCSSVMRAVAEHPVPVVAAVEGTATAAGCQLVAACDIALAGPGARFCTPGVEIGLFCSTPAVALSRAVGRKAALEMLFTGRFVSADEAAAIGLVNRVVPQPRAEALALASAIAGRSGRAVRMGKRGFLAQEGRGLAAAYEEAGRVMVENLLAEDAREGIGAFLDKRAPHWTDR